MITKTVKKNYRADIFRHLDGLVVAPIAHAIRNYGVADLILERKECALEELSRDSGCNKAYLNVALKVIADQGWIEYQVHGEKIIVTQNEKTKPAFALFHLYEGIVELLDFSGHFHPRKFRKEPFLLWKKKVAYFKELWSFSAEELTDQNGIPYQIYKHIEGHLIGPTIVLLGMNGMFHKYFMDASFQAEEFHDDSESFSELLDFLCHLGWYTKENNHYSFTEKGLFFAKRAAAYGVTVSYLPMFRKTNALLKGDTDQIWKSGVDGKETHVDREMNVWGSGGAHAAYFKKVDEIIVEIFNQPIENQPKGIVDMGCGNGAFLIHLFDVIEKRTLRGEMLEEYPLFLVGADFNKAALKVARANLIQADIWAKVIFGDISDPALLSHDLNVNYGIALNDLLSVRTFLDHNRIWKEPSSELLSPSLSQGAFAYRGKFLSTTQVEKNLKDHFSLWAPFIDRHGLIVIELHTVPSQTVAQHIGSSAITAYDATHGFSDQYILEISAFLKVLKEIGLVSDPKYFSKFPNSELACISVNYIVKDHSQ